MATMSPPGDELVITYIIVILTHLRLAGSILGPSILSPWYIFPPQMSLLSPIRWGKIKKSASHRLRY